MLSAHLRLYLCPLLTSSVISANYLMSVKEERLRSTRESLRGSIVTWYLVSSLVSSSRRTVEYSWMKKTSGLIYSREIKNFLSFVC